MKNIEMKVDGNILTVKVDLTQDFGSHHHQGRPLSLPRQKGMSLLMVMRLRSG